MAIKFLRDTDFGGIAITNFTIDALNAPIGVSNGGTGLTSTPTNGQLLIGNGTGFTLATLTAGSGVSITNEAGSITVSNSIPDFICSATATTTTTSATYAISDMTVTPGAGTYLVLFNTQSSVNNNADRNTCFAIYENGAIISHSQRIVFTTDSGRRTVVSTQAIATVTAGQAIDVRWAVSGSTATMYERSLILIKLSG